MPNWTTNRARYTGDPKEIKRLKDLMGPEFDFDAIIPMPETLNMESGSRTNDAIIYYLCGSKFGGVEKVAADRKAQEAVLEHVKFRVPGAVEDLAKRIPLLTDEDRAKLYDDGRAYVSNIENYGYPTWYEWRCAHWGTKWPACDCSITKETDTCIEWSFDTAWCVPGPVYEAVKAAFPRLASQIYWENEDDWAHHGHTVKYTPPEPEEVEKPGKEV